MTWLRLVVAAAAIAAGSSPAYAASQGRSGGIAFGAILLSGLVLAILLPGFRTIVVSVGFKAALEAILKGVLAVPGAWLVMVALDDWIGLPEGWTAYAVWAVLAAIVWFAGGRMVPAPLRRLWASLFPSRTLDTHGSAHFGTAATGARHLARAAPADAFVLGVVPDAPRRSDARFRQDGHILTCAPTGAGKGIGAVIPNLLAYPGSAFVLDFKGENYAVTARARRELGQHVILVDPFGITGQATHALNWLDSLDPGSPDVVSRAAGTLVANFLAMQRGRRNAMCVWARWAGLRTRLRCGRG